MSPPDKPHYGFAIFVLVLCLLVASVYFWQAYQQGQLMDQQLQELKQIQQKAQPTVPPGKPSAP